MEPSAYRTPSGRPVTAVTAAEMAEVDRVAVEEVGLSLLVMMENAGRALAATVQARVLEGPVTVLVGGGGNGGGGLCAARHLANHGRDVAVVLDREPDTLKGAAVRQLRVLGDAAIDRSDSAAIPIDNAAVLVDALVGYSLVGGLRGRAAELAGMANESSAPTVSLDVPSGIDASTGERSGAAFEPSATVTLALPKVGLRSVGGVVELADIGIPRRVYDRAGIDPGRPFANGDWQVELESTKE